MRRDRDNIKVDYTKVEKESGRETSRALRALVRRIERGMYADGRVSKNVDVAQVKASKVVIVPSLGKVYLDNGDDSYIWEAAADQIQVVVGGSGAFKATSTGSVFTSSVKGTTGDPSGEEGMLTINTVDKTISIYAGGAWRALTVTWP